MADPWDDDEEATEVASSILSARTVHHAFRVTIVEGADTGQSWRVDPNDPNPALMGQSESCHIRVRDPKVSRRHTKLEPAGVRLRLRDLESTNGTRVDGVAVVEAFIDSGALVRIGNTSLRIERMGEVEALAPSQATQFGSLRGASLAMRRIYPLAKRLAKANVPVIIEGETGTGKELLAESIHEESPRSNGPYVVFDCTAFASTLVDSELFGHERGAFTGADARRRGVFEQAHGGTLFIDEIGDLSIDLQPKLLRVIERREWRRLGSTKTRRFDARIVAATRRDLDADIERGAFRDDLFHRLAIASVELPPLRERRGDILLLAQTFWRELGGPPSGPPTSLLTDWERERWAGNVRELRNAVARALALGTSRHVPLRRSRRADHVDIAAVLDRQLPIAAARALLVDEFERRYVERVLREHDGNVTQAALAAGVSRRYLHRLKSRWSEES